MTILEVCRSLALDTAEVDVVGRRLDGMAFAWDRLYKVTDDGGKTFYDEGIQARVCHPDDPGAPQHLRAT